MLAKTHQNTLWLSLSPTTCHLAAAQFPYGAVSDILGLAKRETVYAKEMFNQDDSRAGKAAFRFCSECDNMLYPREDRATRRLLYGCRHCNHVEEADSTCVYQHIVSAQAKEQTLGSKDLANDPTFPRASKTCPKCGYHECVFFQSRSKHRDATMKLRYVCSNTQCGHRWTD